jgi:DNA-binding MurR/RpiR family transcriptional regulator
MAENEFLLQIHSAYPSLTKAEKKVADYVLKDPKKVRFMSIHDLADQSGTGLTSVFRFCKTMGLAGFQEFKMKLLLSDFSSEENSAEEESELFSSEITKHDSLEVVAQKLQKNYVSAFTDTRTLLNYDDIKRAADMINDSDQVRFFGIGASMLTAMEGMYKFLHIMPNVYCLSDEHMQVMAASTLNERDVAIFFSHSGENKQIVNLIKEAKGVGARTICITRYKNSPVTEYADIVLLCGGYETPLQDHAYSVKFAQLYVLDILFVQVYRTKFQYSKEINKKVSLSILDKNY